MVCTRCHRYLSKAAATVTTANGSANYGPVCAVAVGLLPATTRKSRTVARRGRRARQDDRQMELLGALA